MVLGAVLLGRRPVAGQPGADLLEFQILFGLLVGIAAGSFYAPLIAVAAVVRQSTAALRSRWCRPAWASRR